MSRFAINEKNLKEMEQHDINETNMESILITDKWKKDLIQRTCLLIFCESTTAVKVVFDEEIHPNKLAEVLRNNYSKLINLRKDKVLSSKQWVKLFPSSGCRPVSSEAFDISLMLTLLRNLTDLQINEIQPSKTDHSRIADISRLLYYRNMICHMSILFDGPSVEKLDDCIQAIKRLTGKDCNDYKTKIVCDSSKDFRVLIDALLFLYREACNVERIGLSCALREISHIDKIWELVYLWILYNLFEPVVHTFWKHKVEGKHCVMSAEFLNKTLNNIMEEGAPILECFKTRYGTISDDYRDTVLCFADKRIKRFILADQKFTNKNYYNLTKICTDTDIIYEDVYSFPIRKAITIREKTKDITYEVKTLEFRFMVGEYEMICTQNKTEILPKSSFSSEIVSFNKKNIERMLSQTGEKNTFTCLIKYSATPSTNNYYDLQKEHWIFKNSLFKSTIPKSLSLCHPRYEVRQCPLDLHYTDNYTCMSVYNTIETVSSGISCSFLVHSMSNRSDSFYTRNTANRMNSLVLTNTEMGFNSSLTNCNYSAFHTYNGTMYAYGSCGAQNNCGTGHCILL